MDALSNLLIEVSLLPLSFSCGSGNPFDDESEWEKILLPKDFVGNIQNPFVVSVSGASMEPFLFDGDYVLFDPHREAKNGDIVACRYNGDVFVKRLQIDRKGIYLVPTNPEYSIIRVCEFDDFEILGIGVKMWRDLKSNSYSYYKTINLFY